MNQNNAKVWRGVELTAIANHGANGGEFQQYTDVFGSKMVKTVNSHNIAEYRCPQHIFDEISNGWSVPSHLISRRHS